MTFGGPIAWRANRVASLSQTVKEAIFISRLFEAMTLRLHEPLIIDCDNTQTLRLIKEDSAKLITKLRHVDIHQLRHEYAMNRVLFQWKTTKEMIADGLTKALPRQRFEDFVRIIGMVDIRERLNAENLMEDLKDKLMAKRKAQGKEAIVHLTH